MEIPPIPAREPAAKMNAKPLVFVVVGTRPEAIKLAPVILALKAQTGLQTEVVLTGQHQDMAGPMLTLFGIQADHDLAVMQAAQSLAGVTARILTGLDALLVSRKPAMVIGQGDTASVLAASMASFFRQIPFAHVEAGLRTGDRFMPFPEEMNRVVTGRYASLHFAPTQTNATALILEGVRPAEIWVTGNTVIDALFYILRAPRPALPTRGKPFVLVTAHRRENHGAPMMEICAAIKALAHEQPAIDFVVPVHPNPLVKNMVEAELSGCANVLLLGPQPYDVFCWLMKECQLILSDSGGVQEEAPALGKPVLVLRDETERPEARDLGATKLVGPHAEAIVREARVLLEMGAAYTRMATAGSPYGDGTASVKIGRVIADALRLGA